MPVEKNKAAVRRLYAEVWTKNKLELIDTLYAPDHMQHNPMPGELEKGLPVMRASLQRLLDAFPDLSIEINLMLARGDEVTAVLTVRGTHRGDYEGLTATGKTFAIAAVVIHRFAAAKIVETWSSRDEASLLRQLGGAPAN